MIKQILKDANTMSISLTVKQSQSNILGIAMGFVSLSQELFSVFTLIN